MTILWLDDKPTTIAYELDLIRGSNKNIDIHTFAKIDELLVLLESKDIDRQNTIFVIDVMLINEDNIYYNNNNVAIPEELMAGVTLYQECLNEHFDDIPTILYTSRGGGNQDIFQQIKDDKRYEKSLFVVGKEELNTKFKKILAQLSIQIW